MSGRLISLIPFVGINTFHVILFECCIIFHTRTHRLLNLKKKSWKARWVKAFGDFGLEFKRTSSCFCLSLSTPTCLLNDCKMFDVSVFLFGVCGGCWLIGSVDDTENSNETKYYISKKVCGQNITYSIPFPLAANWSSWLVYLCPRTMRDPLKWHSMWYELVEIDRLEIVHSENWRRISNFHP